MKTFKLKSYAKINLGLEIVGKRKDEYHTLKTIFQTIDISDSIFIKQKPDNQINISSNNKTVDWGKDNTISKSFNLIYKLFNLNTGFDIFIDKRIPPGSGLGGGSSNAASIILFLNYYFKLNISTEDLIKIAAIIGADVPFFLFGGSVLGEGIGEILTPLPDFEICSIGLLIPEINVPTKKIFALYNLTTNPFNSRINTFLKSRDYNILENHLEEITFRLFPEIEEIKKVMRKDKNNLVLMSGTGSSVYTIAPQKELLNLQEIFPKLKITRFINSINFKKNIIGVWPSGKASVFGADIRGFKSSRPSFKKG